MAHGAGGKNASEPLGLITDRNVQEEFWTRRFLPELLLLCPQHLCGSKGPDPDCEVILEENVLLLLRVIALHLHCHSVSPELQQANNITLKLPCDTQFIFSPR